MSVNDSEMLVWGYVCAWFSFYFIFIFLRFSLYVLSTHSSTLIYYYQFDVYILTSIHTNTMHAARSIRLLIIWFNWINCCLLVVRDFKNVFHLRNSELLWIIWTSSVVISLRFLNVYVSFTVINFHNFLFLSRTFSMVKLIKTQNKNYAIQSK